MNNYSSILIISNCQVQPLKHGLAQTCNKVEIETIGVHIVPEVERGQIFSSFIEKKNHYKFVLSVQLSDDFGALSSQQIEKSFHPTPVFFISNLTFRGTHPDITYIGGLNQRAPGPIGDYHSQIALLTYLMGLNPIEAAKMYCDGIYTRLGYYDEFVNAFHSALL
jgi:hypothetical protein